MSDAYALAVEAAVQHLLKAMPRDVEEDRARCTSGMLLNVWWKVEPDKVRDLQQMLLLLVPDTYMYNKQLRIGYNDVGANTTLVYLTGDGPMWDFDLFELANLEVP